MTASLWLAKIFPLRALSGVLRTIGPLAISRRATPRFGQSHDDRGALHDLEALPAEAEHARLDLVRGSEVDDQQGIRAALDDAIEQLHQFGVSASAQSALGRSELQPLAIAFHQLEDATRSAVVADVVGHEMEMFVHRCLTGCDVSAGGEVGIVGPFAHREAAEQARLEFQQAPVAQPDQGCWTTA